jgi:hypothetical protein
MPVAAVSFGRQAERQVRLADCALRDEVRADDPDLAAVLQVHECCATDFAPRPGGRRNGNDRRDCRGDQRDAAIDRRVPGKRALVGGEDRHRLREVDRRAAAEADQTVATLALVALQRRDRGGLGRVGWHSVEHDPGHAGRHGVEQAPEEPRGGHAPVRYDQRARDAERRKILRQFLQNPVPEADRGQVGDQGHRCVPG